MIIEKINNENNFYIDINLSFFDGEKTEKPTSHKLGKARDEGQVAISKEIGTAVLFICGFLTLKAFGSYMYENSVAIFQYSYNLIADIDAISNKSYLIELIIYILLQILLICLPIFAVLMIVGLIASVVQVGWHPTLKPIKPKFSAFNPVNGFKRIFSVNSLIELVKSLLKLFLVSYVIYFGLKDEITIIPTLMLMDIKASFIYIADLSLSLGIKVGVYYIIIAALDYAYQKYSHIKKLKMSKQEVKDEMKQMMGDPQVKGKIKRKMQEVSMRRMMQQVPEADVIITNPTHYAVAIKYDAEKASAPLVTAKGVDHLARRIKEVAKENKVEIVENRPLARALYNTVDIGKEIPPELYQAVAEVLAFVYKLKNNI